MGTPGETLTPQTTYIPPPDAGRRRSRRAPARGGRKMEGKAGRFDKGDFIPPPKALSLEDRIAGRLDPDVPGEIKPVRLVEGSTVKEFAEKLGIKPKDVVTLLLATRRFRHHQSTSQRRRRGRTRPALWLRSHLRSV